MTTNKLKDFRILYNKLDEILASKTDIEQHGAFIHKLQQFLKKYPSFRWLEGEMRQIHDLRNVLVHEEKYREDIATPTEGFITRIKGIIKTLQNPQSALEISTRDVYKAGLDARILDVVSTMAENMYSQIPIFTDPEKGKGFIGVFSESLFFYLIGKGDNALLQNTELKKEAKINDIKNLLNQPINEGWAFVPADMDTFKIQKLFQTKTFPHAKLPHSRLGALFVTNHGKTNENFLGIITSFDLSKINQKKI